MESHWDEGGRASGRGQGEAPSPGERGLPGAPVSRPAPRAPDLDLGRWLSSRAATSRVRPAATRQGRPVRGQDNVAIVWALQTRPAGRWEGRGAAGARAARGAEGSPDAATVPVARTRGFPEASQPALRGAENGGGRGDEGGSGAGAT